jgi:lipopolysaccharide transport system permease protein
MSATSLTGSRLAHFYELVAHLARRELTVQHRWTLLGWAWPLARQLAQLAVLVFVFSKVFELDIENYGVFVFSGLIAYSWFSAGVLGATTAVLDQRHLVFQPRFPPAAVPVVAVAVPFIDVLVALPVLLLMMVFSGDIGPGALLLPPLLAIQLVLMCGIGWISASVSVYLRDIPNVVIVGLTLLFYMTPVFYELDSIPEQYQTVFKVNPLATLIEAYRAALLGSPWPSALRLAAVTVLAAAVAAIGLLVFRRLQAGFVDEL